MRFKEESDSQLDTAACCKTLHVEHEFNYIYIHLDLHVRYAIVL